MIILFAFFAQVKSYAIDYQISDSLIYNGKKYILENTIIQPYLKKANKWEWIRNGYGCPELEREYYAIFEIAGNELILKDIRGCTESRLKEFLSAFNVKGSIFKLGWFTDSIVIGKDEPIYGGVYEYYSILNFEKGMLIKETDIDYKEYLSNKLKKQLEALSGEDWRIKIRTHDLEYEHQAYLDVIEHYLESKKEDKSEFLTELKTRYEKKFKKPMSDSELKIQQITFRNNGYTLEITRTLYGARAEYNKYQSGEHSGELMEIKLNTEEWLDIIRALSTYCLGKLKLVPKPISNDYSNKKGSIYIYFSGRNIPYDERYEFIVKSGRLQNFKKFEKVMKNIIAKIKKSDKYLKWEMYSVFIHVTI